MSPEDAFEDEMDPIRSITEEDEQRLLRGEAPAGEELANVASFLRALRALREPASEALSASLPVRLAEAARFGSTPARWQFQQPSVRAPRRLLRIAAAVAAIPLLFAGLAFAGVGLPSPAQSAFESVGIDLPNQPKDDDTEGTAKDGDSAGSETGQRNSAGKLGHGRSKSNPAREGGRAQGTKGRGRALGKRGLAPGRADPPAGSPGRSNSAGRSESAPAGGAADPPARGNSGSGGGGSPPAANGRPPSGGSGGGKP